MMKTISQIIFLFLLTGCSDPKRNDTHQHDKERTLASKAIQYTCSMHPQIIKDQPGKCPICGMDLVPLNKSDRPEIVLSDNQVALANITTAKVLKHDIAKTVIVNGKVANNEEQTSAISSRVSGRIEKLFFKETGRTVKQGAPLYEIYSETLLTLQREYQLAKEQSKVINKEKAISLSFLNAAEKKLLLYGLNKNQINGLPNTNALSGRTTFLSPTDGVITEINISEGKYISEGDPLYKIENLKTLWVEAELYPDEASLTKPGDEVEIRINGFESHPIKAIVSFLSPEYKANSQILIMRITLENPDRLYKPGMQAKVLFKQATKNSLVIPTSAVVHNGNRTHVFIEIKPNTFQPREVKTGIENAYEVEITDGLTEGEVIAVTGAYLLYSDLALKGTQLNEHH